MYYDALTLAAMVDELREPLLDGRVQRVVRPSELLLGLEIYSGRRYQLLFSAETRSPGVFLVETRLRRGVVSPSPLELLLRKYVRGARLRALQQPALERVLRLSFEGEHGAVDLVCEIMGRLSNAILLGPDEVIMESVKRVPPSVNRYRTILPQHRYVPPPPQKKEHPLLRTTSVLREILDNDAKIPLWRQLVNGVASVSPLLAREIAFRATGDIDPPLPLRDELCRNLVAVMDDLFHLPDTHAWSPCVAYTGDGDVRRPAEYSAYTLEHLPDRESAETISAAIRCVMQARGAQDAYDRVRERLHRMIDEGMARQLARVTSMRASIASEEEMNDLQFRGSAILNMAWSIEPGQRELVVDPSASGAAGGAFSEPVRIPLDVSLSPSENAQKLFRRYRKMRAATLQVPKLIREGELELTYLRQLHTDVELAEDRAQLDAVEAELREAGYMGKRRGGPTTRPKSKVPSVLNVYAGDGTLILIGRNSRENEEVTFRRGAPDDIWLHARGMPGSHVIIKGGGASVAEDTLRFAAGLAAYYSAGRSETRVQVDYTERRHVRRIRGGRAGMVSYSHEDTMVVKPPGPKADQEMAW